MFWHCAPAILPAASQLFSLSINQLKHSRTSTTRGESGRHIIDAFTVTPHSGEVALTPGEFHLRKAGIVGLTGVYDRTGTTSMLAILKTA